MRPIFVTLHFFVVLTTSLVVSRSSLSQTTTVPDKAISQPTQSDSPHFAISANWIPSPLRRIGIPFRVSYYEDIQSQVVASKADLDGMLESIPQPPKHHRNERNRSWRDLQTFRRLLLEHQIDFSREVIVLIQHTEGSGTPKVSLAHPLHDSNTRRLLLEVRSYNPGLGTRDLAAYCFAVVVPRHLADEVIITTTGNASVTVNSKTIQSTRKKREGDVVIQVPPPKNAVEQ
jgi:hypothetical protein